MISEPSYSHIFSIANDNIVIPIIKFNNITNENTFISDGLRKYEIYLTSLFNCAVKANEKKEIAKNVSEIKQIQSYHIIREIYEDSVLDSFLTIDEMTCDIRLVIVSAKPIGLTDNNIIVSMSEKIKLDSIEMIKKQENIPSNVKYLIKINGICLSLSKYSKKFLKFY